MASSRGKHAAKRRPARTGARFGNLAAVAVAAGLTFTATVASAPTASAHEECWDAYWGEWYNCEGDGENIPWVEPSYVAEEPAYVTWECWFDGVNWYC